MRLFRKEDVAGDVRRRKVEILLHSTHLTINLPRILEDGYVDTARGLRGRLGEHAERLLHDPRRLEKFAVGLDYINCSLTDPNYELLYARSKSAWQAEWVHFKLSLELLSHPDTMFCPVSAAQDHGQHVTTGLEGFRTMFAEQVDTYSRDGLSKNEPTHPQAEVLINGKLPLELVQEIITPDAQAMNEVQRLLEFYHQKIPVTVEPKFFLWPKRLKK
ncbi:MAG: DUF4433 domain-containing protein [Calditrichaeota bacterium]|nr:DUF4433 domain-containing protein [Calditrichota bacterium]